MSWVDVGGLTTLTTPRKISGVSFDGSADIVTGASLFTPKAYVTGNYYYCFASTGITTANTQGNGTVRVAPWVVVSSLTISAVWLEYTAAGEAGSVYRAGLWAADANGQPATLVKDFGTVATDGTPAVVEIAVSPNLAIQPGLYWIGGAVQGAPTTQPTMRVTSSTPIMGGPLGTSLPAANNSFASYTKTGQTGAFGDLSSVSGGGGSVRMGFKVA